MKRVAIIGGGLSGLTAAYELSRRARDGAPIEFTLFEKSARLGGTIETVHQDGFTIECGPDGWVSEKPWARELANELGLSDQLIESNDAGRKTYIFDRGRLRAMPDGMRMMVPTDLDAVTRSDLFSHEAIRAFCEEPDRADALRAQAPAKDESIANFTRRHFGDEVLRTVAAPLLSGVFGGDVHRLSVRAVMAPFVAVEREHGSLIRGFQAREQDRLLRPPRALFTTLRSGLGTLIDALASQLPKLALRLSTQVLRLEHEVAGWIVHSAPETALHLTNEADRFDHVILSTPLGVTRALLRDIDTKIARLLPERATSAIIVALAWKPSQAETRQDMTFRPPPGFGFLVPPSHGLGALFARRLLAATFVEQKFPDRVPLGGYLIRTFFGGVQALSLLRATDADLAEVALRELRTILGRLPTERPLTIVRRWPGSLPQYEVGHVERMADLEQRISTLPGLHVLGNALHGVGLPDLIRQSRAAARQLAL